VTLPPVWDVTTHYALEDVRKAAAVVGSAPDTEAAKQALLAVRAAAIKAYGVITDAEAETRRLALARAFA
jgi:hypothetical protein